MRVEQVIKVGITGGIGSGKTTIAYIFKRLGYPVYIADREASRLINQNEEIYAQFIKHFGTAIYDENHILNKKKLADLIFNDKEALTRVNAIVHPIVLQDFIRWGKQQKRQPIFFESAILFETGWEKEFDYIICVTAATDTKIQRVIERDHTTRDKVLERMANQMDDWEKCKKSDFIINTDEGKPVLEQVLMILEKVNFNLKTTI